MAKTLDKSKKRTRVNSTKKQKLNESSTQQQQQETEPSSPTTTSSSDSSDSEPENPQFDPEELRELLQPYSKDQLVDLVCSAAKIGSSIYTAVVEAADRDVTHRKIFVYGLPWETTRETLVGVFESYGEVEECTVVIDKVTGKAKGFGFVMFKSRKGAREALKEPKKRILNRIATCQLAAMGSGKGQGQGQEGAVKINMGSQGQVMQQQQGFNGSPFMYHPGYGMGMLGNPGLVGAAAAGGYMYPMLAGALNGGGLSHEMLLQGSQMGGIGEGGGGLAYFRGQGMQNVYPDSDNGKRGAGKDSDAGGSFQGY